MAAGVDVVRATRGVLLGVAVVGHRRGRQDDGLDVVLRGAGRSAARTGPGDSSGLRCGLVLVSAEPTHGCILIFRRFLEPVGPQEKHTIE